MRRSADSCANVLTPSMNEPGSMVLGCHFCLYIRETEGSSQTQEECSVPEFLFFITKETSVTSQKSFVTERIVLSFLARKKISVVLGVSDY